MKAAEEHFAKAKAGGVAIDRYLDPMAEAAFASANALLEKGDFPKAEAALAAVEKGYAATPWLAAHKAEVAAARAAAKGGIAEAEAEELYRQAAKLAKESDLWALKPLIDNLKADYAATKPVTDAARKPSFAEMADSVAKLGKFLTVRQDGRGDYRTVEEALAAAPPNSTIEITDSATYAVPNPPGYQRIQKDGITLRGARTCWPTIALGYGSQYPCIWSYGARTSIEHLIVLSHNDYEKYTALGATRGTMRLVSVLVYVRGMRTAFGSGPDVASEIKGCVFVGGLRLQGPSVLRDSVVLQGELSTDAQAEMANVAVGNLTASGPATVRSCTVWGSASLASEPTELRDSIVGLVEVGRANTRIEACNILRGMAGIRGFAKPGERCFSAAPQFRDPDNLDYRLKPTSPYRKKASDGGDIGCRFTDEMLEMLKLAHELRRKGIIKF